MDFIAQYKASISSAASPAMSFALICEGLTGGLKELPVKKSQLTPPLKLLACGNSSLPARSKVCFCALKAFRLIYVAQGTLTLAQKSFEFTASSGCVLALSCESEYSLSASDNANLLEWFISGSSIDYYADLLRQPEYCMTWISPKSAFPRLANDFIRNFSSMQDDELSQLEALGALLHSLVRESRIYKNHSSVPQIPSYLAAIHDRVTNDFSRPCSLDELEEQFKISKFRLSREFTSVYGSSIIATLNNRRLDAAAQLLVSTDYRINVIGVMVGFDNTDHFIRLFKRRYAQTPGAYRTSVSYLK